MGNCIARCCGKDKRKYLRTRYSVDRDFSIEFENLMDDEAVQDEMNKPLTDHEKELLSAKQFNALIHEQKLIDAEIGIKLAKQEEELRMEEEAYYEARREAARIARLQRVAKEQAAKNFSKIGATGRSWLGDNENEWDVAGGEDDFEMFLASVKARSLSARTQLRQGIVPQKAPRSATEENLVALAAQEILQVSPVNSNDLEWDNDYVSADILEREQLLTEKKTSKAT